MSNPACPICEKPVAERDINAHIDSGCQDHIQSADSQSKSQPLPTSTQTPGKRVANFFSRPTPNKQHDHASSPAPSNTQAEPPPSTSTSTKPVTTTSWSQGSNGTTSSFVKPQAGPADSVEQRKRSADTIAEESNGAESGQAPAKRVKPNHLEKAAPLAERSRPKSLDEVCGQDLVGPEGVLRGLIEVWTFAECKL
jgi:putative ATPase